MVEEVRSLRRSDASVTSRIHLDVLDMEFVAKGGPGLLLAYHRAWIDSPHAIAIGALDDRGAILGALLGSVDPAAHYRFLVRRHGATLACRLLAAAVSRPAFGRELLGTRAKRYLRAVMRILTRAGRSAPRSDEVGPRGAVGEVTHVMVRRESQNSGAGRALMAEAGRRGAGAGLVELVLVTPPDLPATAFYEALGWRRAGEVVSRSGEPFLRYRLPLP
jgi:GNAT superfamily N-acetyltransferase